MIKKPGVLMFLGVFNLLRCPFPKTGSKPCFRRLFLLPVVGLVALLSACGGGQQDIQSSESSSSAQSSQSVTSSSVASEPSPVTSDRTALDWDWSSEAKVHCESRNDESTVPGEFRILRPETSDHLYASEHFVLRWRNGDGVNIGQSTIDNALATLESVWRFYIDELKFPEPYADTAIKYKVSVNVSDQGYASGAGTGERDPEMWVHYDALGHVGTLAHEFAHTLQFTTRSMRDSQYVGWFWESHANWMAHLYNPSDLQCTEALVNAPHIYYGSTRNRYCNWMFFEFLKDNSCPAFVNDAIWRDGLKLNNPARLFTDPFSTLATNAGWDTEELNDIFAEWALHNVAWDYQDAGANFERGYGNYSREDAARRFRVTRLLPTSVPQQYQVPHYWAPQRWGYNLVQLLPDSSAERVTIAFDGVVQQASAIDSFRSGFSLQPDSPNSPDSAWRWSVVAVDQSGNPRYSQIQRGVSGQLDVEILPDDRSLWLVVMATPSEIHQIFWDQIYYSIYRYPWRVTLTGARPAPFSDHRANLQVTGAPHPNGGGFVAASASVSPTVYVGPNAMVLEQASVEGYARVEDFAVVKGRSHLSDRARISEYAELSGNGRVIGDAVVDGHALVRGGTVSQMARIGGLSHISGGTVSGNARVEATMNAINRNVGGSAQLYGDIELNTDVNIGVFYGFVDSGTASDPALGAQRSSPEPEVTVPPND